MVMPGMPRKATYLELRASDNNVVVFLMSGHTLNEDVQEILDLGVRAFMSKPNFRSATCRVSSKSRHSRARNRGIRARVPDHAATARAAAWRSLRRSPGVFMAARTGRTPRDPATRRLQQAAW